MKNKSININNKYCTLLSLTEQRAKGYKLRFENSNYYDIYQAYERPSQAKINAWNKIVKDALIYNSYDAVIIGFNTSQFSVAHTEYNAKDNITYLIVDTANNRYALIYKSGK